MVNDHHVVWNVLLSTSSETGGYTSTFDMYALTFLSVTLLLYGCKLYTVPYNGLATLSGEKFLLTPVYIYLRKIKCLYNTNNTTLKPQKL